MVEEENRGEYCEVRSGKMELSRKERWRMDRAYGLTEKGTLSVREFLKFLKRVPKVSSE